MSDSYYMAVQAERKIDEFETRVKSLEAALRCTKKALVDAKTSDDYGYAKRFFARVVEGRCQEILSDIEEFTAELGDIERECFKEENDRLPREIGPVGYEVGQ